MNDKSKSEQKQREKDLYFVESFFTESLDKKQILKKILEQKLRQVKFDFG